MSNKRVVKAAAFRLAALAVGEYALSHGMVQDSVDYKLNSLSLKMELLKIGYSLEKAATKLEGDDCG